MAGYIGWVPGKDAPSQPAAPSDEDIRGLYEDLDFDPKAHEIVGRHAGSALGIRLSMHVRSHSISGMQIVVSSSGSLALLLSWLTLGLDSGCHSWQCHTGLA